MEWTVVTVIVVLIGLIAAVAKPIVNLNSTITKLDTTLDIFLKRYDKDCGDNEKEHKRFGIGATNRARTLATSTQG